MSGHGAILVLERARAKVGDARFMGCRAQAIREAGLELDEDTSDAVRLLSTIPSIPPELLLKRVSDAPQLQWPSIRRRMAADFDAGIQRLLTVADSLRKRRGVEAARRAQNWSNLKPDEASRDAEFARTFEAAHKDVSKEIAS